MSFVIQFFRGKMIGYLVSWEINSAYFRRLSDRMRPSSSNLGFKANNLLFRGNSFFWSRVVYSFGNAVFWALLINSICSSAIPSGVNSPLCRSSFGSRQFFMNLRTQAWTRWSLFQLERFLGSNRSTLLSSWSLTLT